jgi:hypothetical protein
MRRSVALLFTLAAIPACGEPESRNMSRNDVAAALSGLAIQPGEWEVASAVTGVSAPNLPILARNRMIGPRGRARGCITPEQAARPDAGFLAGPGRNNCSFGDFAMTGGRITGIMRCTEPSGGITTARMTGDYARDGYRLDMTIETPAPDGATMRIDTRTIGRRIGDCPAVARP